MKIIAAILAILTLYMSVQKPVLSTEMDVPDKETCSTGPSCGKKNDSSKRKDNPVKDNNDHNKCCDTGLCNPFGACCSYLLAGKHNLELSCILPASKKRNWADENGLSFYIREVWKPPKRIAIF